MNQDGRLWDFKMGQCSTSSNVKKFINFLKNFPAHDYGIMLQSQAGEKYYL